MMPLAVDNIPAKQINEQSRRHKQYHSPRVRTCCLSVALTPHSIKERGLNQAQAHHHRIHLRTCNDGSPVQGSTAVRGRRRQCRRAAPGRSIRPRSPLPRHPHPPGPDTAAAPAPDGKLHKASSRAKRTNQPRHTQATHTGRVETARVSVMRHRRRNGHTPSTEVLNRAMVKPRSAPLTKNTMQWVVTSLSPIHPQACHSPTSCLWCLRRRPAGARPGTCPPLPLPPRQHISAPLPTRRRRKRSAG